MAATGVDMATTGVNTASTGVDTATTGVDMATIGVDMATTGVDMATTGVDMATAGVNMATTGVDMATTGVDTATVGVDTATVGVDMATTGVDMATTGYHFDCFSGSSCASNGKGAHNPPESLRRENVPAFPTSDWPVVRIYPRFPRPIGPHFVGSFSAPEGGGEQDFPTTTYLSTGTLSLATGPKGTRAGWRFCPAYTAASVHPLKHLVVRSRSQKKQRTGLAPSAWKAFRPSKGREMATLIDHKKKFPHLEVEDRTTNSTSRSY
eukprot:1195739-Prorocentrum_minimum.AAC.6